MTDNRVPYGRSTSSPPVTLEGKLVSDNGQPVPPPQGWRQHPTQIRPSRLQPHARPSDAGPIDQFAGVDPSYGQFAAGTNVTVNNGGQFYRPWKEELLISGWRSFGNFLAWPFRLVGRFVEHVVLMFAGVLKLALMAVVLPSLLFAGVSFYQSHKDQPAGETAHEVGKAGVGLVGSVLGGIWDGIFGDDDPAPTKR